MANNRQKATQRKAMKKKARSKAIVKKHNIARNNKVSKHLENKKPEELTARDLMLGISQTISVVAPVHAAIEVYDTLVKEGKVTPLTEEQQETVNGFDRATVRLGEDTNVITGLIDAGSKPSEFPELVLAMMDHVQDIVTVRVQDMMQEGSFLQVHRVLIDEYIKEHKTDDETMLDLSLRLSDSRMKRVGHLYVTKEHSSEPLEGAVNDIGFVDEEPEEPEVFKVEDTKDSTPLEC